MRIPDHLTCLLRNVFAGQQLKLDMEQTRTKLGEEYIKGIYFHYISLNLAVWYWNTEISPRNTSLKIHKRREVITKYINVCLLIKLQACFSVHFSSVAQSCPTLCDPMNRNTPGLPVHHQLPESTQTHVHPSVSSPVIPFSSCPQSFPASRSLPMSQLFASDGQRIGVSPSTSVLPMNTLDWSPLGWTGWISLQSRGLSRVFSNTIVHQFFSTQLSL